MYIGKVQEKRNYGSLMLATLLFMVPYFHSRARLCVVRTSTPFEIVHTCSISQMYTHIVLYTYCRAVILQIYCSHVCILSYFIFYYYI